QRSTHTTPAPVLGLRTASYCTENEGTPICTQGEFDEKCRISNLLFYKDYFGAGVSIRIKRTNTPVLKFWTRADMIS
ncbi:hypothetical protein, partial [Polaromonas aquatica]